jgi:hypothetical protein
MSSPYTVRIKTPLSDTSAQQFALAVSDALVRLSKISASSNVVQAESIQGTTASWSIALYDEVTGAIAFLPGVRFVPVGANDVNVGFELDVSPRVGSGVISGTSQGYMANYGTVGGSKLAAGVSANNEDPNIPRLDLGFKPKRGATMEFYGSDGDSSNTRKGQIRMTTGPGGKTIITQYVSGDTWKVIAGFGPNGELICGYNNWGWPDSTNGPAGTTTPTNAITVYDGNSPTTNLSITATINKNGTISGSKLALKNGSGTVTLDPTAAAASVTLTLQQKYFVDAAGTPDANPTWVLCASTV